MTPKNTLPETLETERLIIRVAHPGDGAVFNEAMMESLEGLTPWLGWVSPPPTLEQSELGCRRAYARYLLNEELMVFSSSKVTGPLWEAAAYTGWIGRCAVLRSASGAAHGLAARG